jgi:hypothetical protein
LETIHGNLEILTDPIFPGSFGNSSKKIHGSFGNIDRPNFSR